MTYAITKFGNLFGGGMQVMDPEKPSLAQQHLEYTLTIERNRAALTQHAMGNTAILMDVAGEIMSENPASAGALKEIMTAYLDATSDKIRTYGGGGF